MPAYTSPDNIQYPVSTDQVAPLETVFANMAQSTQNAFDGFRIDWNDFEANRAIQTFRWADATARSAQTGMVAGDIGYQIDTGMDYRYSGSLWRAVAWQGVVAVGTISGLSTIDIDGLTGFDEYEIILDLPTSTANSNLSMQLRSGGTTDASTNYDYQSDNAADNAASATNALGQTSWGAIAVGGRADKLVIVRAFSLNAARRSMLILDASAFNASANPTGSNQYLRHRSASSFDGVRFVASSGTVTGTYVVKGQRYS